MESSVGLLATPPIDAPEVEIVERKGLGHPDSVCDALAEEFSRALCRYYRDRFGLIRGRVRNRRLRQPRGRHAMANQDAPRPDRRKGAGADAIERLVELGRAEERRGHPLAPRAPHYRPRARNVIFLYMDGGPSQVDTFDPKPRLDRDHGKPIAMAIPKTQFDDVGPVIRSPWTFTRHGESGIPVFEKDFSLTDVYGSEEAFCTGTLAGLVPVAEIDGRPLPLPRPGPVTERLRALYADLLLARSKAAR